MIVRIITVVKHNPEDLELINHYIFQFVTSSVEDPGLRFKEW